jgi:hypothetical protein
MRHGSGVVLMTTAATLAVFTPLLFGGHFLAAENAPQASPAPAQQPVPAPANATTKTPPAPAPKVVLDAKEVSGILGKEVKSAANEDMGRIIDVIVDRGGIARAAVIDFGGFLGVGSRKIAVDWSALHFSMQQGQERITLEMTRDQVKAAPQYQEGKPIFVLGATGDLDMSRLTSAAPER